MSKPVHIEWLPSDDSAVCLAQTSNAGVPLLINGTLSTKDTSVATYATFVGVDRVVTLTSAGDDSGVQFLITGLDSLGNPVAEVIVGPNADTVSTMSSFNVVTSVVPDMDIPVDVSVGTGFTGSSEWFLSDYNKTFAAIGIYVGVGGNLTYSLESTYDDPRVTPVVQGFGLVDGVTVQTVPAASPMFHATTSIHTNLTIPVFASRVLVEASDDTGAAAIYFLQQGVV